MGMHEVPTWVELPHGVWAVKEALAANGAIALQSPRATHMVLEDGHGHAAVAGHAVAVVDPQPLAPPAEIAVGGKGQEEEMVRLTYFSPWHTILTRRDSGRSSGMDCRQRDGKCRNSRPKNPPCTRSRTLRPAPWHRTSCTAPRRP